MARLEAGLRRPVADVARWLRELRLGYVLIGGVAVSLVARPRTTKDVDVLVFLPPGDDEWRQFIRKAEAAGFPPRIPDIFEFSRRTRVFLLCHAATGIGVDISAGGLPFEEEVVQRAKRIRIGRMELPVATPEDLVVMKLIASRAQDLADIESIFSIERHLDLDRVRSYVKLFSIALEAPEMRERLENLIAQRPEPKKRR